MFANLIMRASAFTLAAAVSATLLAGPALAAPDEMKTETRLVSTADLNLTLPADQATMRHRITVAAHQVCRYLEDDFPTASDAFTDCFREVEATAWQQAEAKIAAARGRSVIAFIPK